MHKIETVEDFFKVMDAMYELMQNIHGRLLVVEDLVRDSAVVTTTAPWPGTIKSKGLKHKSPFTVTLGGGIGTSSTVAASSPMSGGYVPINYVQEDWLNQLEEFKKITDKHSGETSDEK